MEGHGVMKKEENEERQMGTQSIMKAAKRDEAGEWNSGGKVR